MLLCVHLWTLLLATFARLALEPVAQAVVQAGPMSRRPPPGFLGPPPLSRHFATLQKAS